MKAMTKLVKRSVLVAAVAAVPVLGFSARALAQYRLNYDPRDYNALGPRSVS